MAVSILFASKSLLQDMSKYAYISNDKTSVLTLALDYLFIKVLV